MRLLLFATVVLATVPALARPDDRPGTGTPAVSQPGRIAAAAQPIAARFHQAAVLLRNGKVLLVGGMSADGRYDSSAELYDPSKNRFEATGRPQEGRTGAASALLPDGNVLIAGGSNDEHGTLRSAELYDPATGKFKSTGELNVARADPVAVPLRSGKVLVVGGGSVPDHSPLASAEIYDSKTGTFSRAGSMHVPRQQFAAVLLTDGRVLIAGGSSAGRYPARTIERSAEIFDPSTGKFVPVGNMAVPRYKLGMAALSGGRVLVVGGADTRDWDGTYSSTEIFDSRTGRFSPGPELSAARFKIGQGVVALSDGRVLVASGSARAEVFDPARNAFSAVEGPDLSGYYFSTATALPDGRVLIVGGYGRDPGAGAVRSAWIYTPQ